MHSEALVICDRQAACEQALLIMSHQTLYSMAPRLAVCDVSTALDSVMSGMHV